MTGVGDGAPGHESGALPTAPPLLPAHTHLAVPCASVEVCPVA